jgi:hypothetical protein
MSVGELIGTPPPATPAVEDKTPLLITQASLERVFKDAEILKDDNSYKIKIATPEAGEMHSLICNELGIKPKSVRQGDKAYAVLDKAELDTINGGLSPKAIKASAVASFLESRTAEISR